MLGGAGVERDRVQLHIGRCPDWFSAHNRQNLSSDIQMKRIDESPEAGLHRQRATLTQISCGVPKSFIRLSLSSGKPQARIAQVEAGVLYRSVVLVSCTRKPGNMSTSNQTILVIDDEAEQHELVRAMLRTEAYSVLEASDYDDALAVQKTHLGEIDLVLIDLRLPGGNGYDLSKDLLAIEPRLKVLFISGLTGAEICKFFDMPMTDLQFLQKPFNPVELRRRLKLLLGLAGPLAGSASAQ
jgi:CheY-like chemotaxis protein